MNILGGLMVMAPLLIIGFGVLWWRLRDDDKKPNSRNEKH